MAQKFNVSLLRTKDLKEDKKNMLQLVFVNREHKQVFYQSFFCDNVAQANSSMRIWAQAIKPDAILPNASYLIEVDEMDKDDAIRLVFAELVKLIPETMDIWTDTVVVDGNRYTNTLPYDPDAKESTTTTTTTADGIKTL